MTRVWVTRDEPPGGPLSAALRHAGLEPVLEPVTTRRIVLEIAGLLAALRPDDWLVLTSEFAIAAVPRSATTARTAVVGEPSRAAAAARGLNVSLVSPDGTGEGLWRALKTQARSGQRILFPRSSLASVPAAWPGVEILAPVLYETIDRTPDPASLAGVSIAAVASPSAAAAAAQAAPEMRFASIGPTTSAALRRLGIEPWAQAARPGFDSLASAIARRLTTGPAAPPATTPRTPAPRT